METGVNMRGTRETIEFLPRTRWTASKGSPVAPQSLRQCSEPNSSLTTRRRGHHASAHLSRGYRAVFIILLLLGSFSQIPGQVTVSTLGGGRLSPSGPDFGFVDGDSLQASQFNEPHGLALDIAGNLYVADRKNGAVRKLDIAGNRASTLISGLNQPVAVAVTQTNEVLVLTNGDGLIRRIDRFNNVTTIPVQLTSPTAMTLDTSGNIYVTESSGNIVRLDRRAEAFSNISAELSSPQGIAILENGMIAVSDSGENRILFIDPDSGRTMTQVGSGIAGFRDGSFSNSQFEQPHQLVKAPNGSLLVVDSGNHRVRIVGLDGTVTTLYGIDPNRWEGQECITCNPIILPGWFDGSAEFAEARKPTGIAVNADGTVFTSETYYHLVREVTSTDLAEGFGSGAGNHVVLPPAIEPSSGYYPLGQDITVSNLNTNALFRNGVYYTTDGTEPSTNSLQVAVNEGTGIIRWRETTRDLTSLRLAAFVGSSFSEVVSGNTSLVNEIGVTRDIAAGPGSTLVIPLTVNLRDTDMLKSLQFLVEVSPATAQTPMISDQFRALSTSEQDFVPIVTSNESEGVSRFNTIKYTDNLAQGIVITYIGTNANFSVRNFGVVGLLAVPIPPEAKLGDRYHFRLLNPSGTSDGAEASIPMRAMIDREIRIAEVSYRVGDSSPATWYNSDEIVFDIGSDQRTPIFGHYGFGDRRLENSDVNNAFSASLGVRVPFPFTDLYDALDAFPEDTESSVGGDGLIRFLDWQIILLRSLQLDFGKWRRSWAGVRLPNRDLTVSANTPSETLTSSSIGPEWIRDAVLASESIGNVSPGVVTDIPVYVTVNDGLQISGLAFRASLEPDGSAPDLSQPLKFVAAPGRPEPVQSLGLSPNVLLCGWPLVPNHAFNPPLVGKTLLGYIRFILPVTARFGQSFTLRFANADGSPDLSTQYDFETRSATVSVQTPAPQNPEIISDEWKTHFFGAQTGVTIREHDDPDLDGDSNLAEYLAGTDPTNEDSRFRLDVKQLSPDENGIELHWQTTSGRVYRLESKSSLLSKEWRVVQEALNGDGSIKRFQRLSDSKKQSFYRLSIQLPQ